MTRGVRLEKKGERGFKGFYYLAALSHYGIQIGSRETRLTSNEGATCGMRDSFAQGKGLGRIGERRAWF